MNPAIAAVAKLRVSCYAIGIYGYAEMLMWDRKQIGEKLAVLRREKRITQQQLADTLKVSRVHISDIECGATTPTVEEFLVLLEILDSTASAFFESNIPLDHQDSDHSGLHAKLQEILDSETPYAFGIEVNVVGMYDAMRYSRKTKKAVIQNPFPAARRKKH